MKIRGLILFFGLLSLLFLGSRPAGTKNRVAQETPAAQETPGPAEAEWTLLFYMDADNNLEIEQMHDLKEMLAAGSTKDVNIVVLADRHPGGDGRRYTNEPIANLKDWTTAKLLYVEKDHLREIADWGEVDMGDPATLKKFLQAGKMFPAKHYGVVLEDHGGGWPGACVDESNNNDMLTTQEIAGALSEAAAANGKFELVGFDACLMANLEVAKAIAPSAHFMVASEETEPGEGWNYTPLLKALAQNPKMNGADLGRMIVDTFDDFFNKSSDPGVADEGDGITLAVLALDQLPSLEKAVSDLGLQDQASLTKEGRDSWLKIARARDHAEEYGKSGESSDGLALFDLHSLTMNLKNDPPDSLAAKSADAVLQALTNVVLYNKHGKGRPKASGLSIFFPSEADALTEKDGKSAYSQMAFSQTGKWLPFLSTYTGADATDAEAPEVEPVATTDHEMGPDDTATVTAQVKADDIDDVSFVLAQTENGEQTILGAIPVEPDDKGAVKTTWDGQWFTIGDKDKELICPISSFQELDAAENTYWVVVPAQVRYHGTNDWFDVSLYFYTDFNGEAVTGDFVSAFQYSRSGPNEIELEAGDDIRAVYLVVDAKGKETYVNDENKEDILHLESTDDIKVGRRRVDKGNYRIGFVITDLAGNRSDTLTDVKVQ